MKNKLINIAKTIGFIILLGSKFHEETFQFAEVEEEEDQSIKPVIYFLLS